MLPGAQASLDGELGGGRSVRGDLAYAIADGQGSWELIFAPNVFGFGQAIYDVPESAVG